MIKKLSRQRVYQLKLKKKKPSVYYSQRRKAWLKYYKKVRKTEAYRKYFREYMKKYRVKKRRLIKRYLSTAKRVNVLTKK